MKTKIKMSLTKISVAAFALMMTWAAPSLAASCRGGEEIHGVEDTSTTYCRSKVAMTWWAAFSWCEAQGRHLATYEEACPGQTRPSSPCRNLKGVTEKDVYSWIALPSGTSNAYIVNLSSGAVYGSYRSIGNSAL
ncbi:MAG: hypothetical protein ACI4OR_00420, partial [Alphaproteobacteria bacterium]